MKLFRIAKKKFINDLSGEGARLYGGRWNKKGTALLYFSEHLSLSVLEILVHSEIQLINSDFYFLEIEIPDRYIVSLKLNELPFNWQSNSLVSSTQDFGTKWIQANESLALKLPSAVLPFENNVLINPHHKMISKLKICKISKLNLDARL